jgi:hypothetical protein
MISKLLSLTVSSLQTKLPGKKVKSSLKREAAKQKLLNANLPQEKANTSKTSEYQRLLTEKLVFLAKRKEKAEKEEA